MIKRALLYILVLLYSVQLYSQNYANDWIDYSQSYYRIPITKEGVYRVTKADLLKFNINTTEFDERNLEMYYKGQKVPIYYSGTDGTGNIEAGDYFEFYAQPNDAWLDTAMYKDYKPLNPYKSSVNDTSNYFLCIANSLNTLRYDTVNTTKSTNFSGKLIQAFFNETAFVSIDAVYYGGETSPYYTSGQGWADTEFSMGGSKTYPVSTPYFYAGVNKPYIISYSVACKSSEEHDLVVQTDGYLKGTSFSGLGGLSITDTVYFDLTSTTQVKFSSIGTSGKKTDNMAFAYVDIKYPREYNFGGKDSKKVTVPKQTGVDSLYFKIDNFDGGTKPFVFIPELNKRIVAFKVGLSYVFALPNPNKEFSFYIAAESSFRSVSKIISVATRNDASNKFFDLSKSTLSNPKNEAKYIIISHTDLWSSAVTYRAYRESTEGSAVLIDVNELYNQFGYGIQKHPMAIHNFIEYAVNEWNIKPEHVFLLGKGYHTRLFKKDATIYKNTLVPTMGETASDLLFATDLHANTMALKVPIGRLAARSTQDVNIYYNKVLAHEAQDSALWMKNVIHFGGGNTAAEQRQFKRYLSGYESILEAEYFGANVNTFLKESSDVFEQTAPEIVRQLVNEGVSMITFFGHSYSGSFDQSLEPPGNFENEGRFPLIVANSCYAGDVFVSKDWGINEQWVFEEDKGAIAFLASVDEGSPVYLDKFMKGFCTAVAKTNYGGTIGNSVKDAVTYVNNTPGIAPYMITTMNYVLHGDPAIKLHSFSLPDLEVNQSSLVLNPGFVSTDLLNFTTDIVIYNNQKAVVDSFDVRVVFSKVGEVDKVFDTIMVGSFLHDTLRLVHDMRGFTSGTYTMSVILDVDSSIVESDENNNSAIIDFFISSKDVLPVSPQNYAIIPHNTVSLKVCAVDPLNVPDKIIIQIDSTTNYNSAVFETDTLETNGAAISTWIPSNTFVDGATYFWRVTGGSETKWNEFSFTYEEGKTGWAQIKARQFSNNHLSQMEYFENEKKYFFVDKPSEAFVQAIGTPTTLEQWYSSFFEYDGTHLEKAGHPVTQPALHVMVFDSANAKVLMSDSANFGQSNYPEINGRARYHLAYYATSVPTLEKLATFLEETVPSGNHIMVYGYYSPHFENWPENLYTAFEHLGAKAPRNTPNYYPWIFYAQKGDTTTAKEVVGETPFSIISMSAAMNFDHFEGSITSPLIGPSKNFKEIVWKSEDIEESDISQLAFKGVPLDKPKYTIDFSIFYDTVPRLDTLVDANYVPYIELQNSQYDEWHRSPADLKYWKVYYDPAGEIAIAPEHAFSFYADTIKQGDFLNFKIAAQNIGAAPMDSVLLMYEIRNQKNEFISSTYHRLSALDVDEFVTDSLKVHTQNLAGVYSCKIEFNPINPETGIIDQPEAYKFNNFIILPFYVSLDKTNPLIDVIVDGRHVLQNDIISSNPEIIIQVYDENEYQFLQDTSLFSIYVVNLETLERTDLYFSGSVLSFIPAQDSTHTAIILCNPIFTENGAYEMYIQAKDPSGNLAGENEYVLQFTIDQEQKVSVLYNYPNPCKSYTIFRFVLAGSEVPENAKIQVFTESGELLKELLISNNDIHIGTNIIDLSWNGRDKYGLPLPSGIYPYRLVFDNKDEYGHYNTEHDEVMDVLYGKLIIAK